MNSINYVLPYIKERKRNIAMGIIALMVVDVLQLLIPRIIGKAIDSMTDGTATPLLLFKYAAAIAVMAVFIAAFRFVWRYNLIGTSRVIERRLRERLFSHIQNLSARFFLERPAGDIMAHATNDINNIRMASGMGMVALTDAIFLGSLAIFFMATIDPVLTAYALLPMPAVAFFTRIFGKMMHERYTRAQERFSLMTETVREAISGIRTVAAYNLEEIQAERLARHARRYIKENLRLTTITGTFFPMMILMTNISLCAVLLIGGTYTVKGRISPGDLVAFFQYLNLLTWPMMAMGWVTNLIQRGRASLDRIGNILDTEPDIKDPERPEPFPILASPPGISIKNITFKYPGKNHPAISSLDLEIPGGCLVGITGPPGCGKTTLLDLICRKYDVEGGSIKICNKDIRNVKKEDLAEILAYMPQRPFLFSGSIRENICLTTGQDEARMIESARAAAIHDTIMGFPDGYDTEVGERGILLSGGQKQRLMLARALYTQRPILLLDDPAGQLDAETEKKVIGSISELAGKKTIIIVSHRISAFKNAGMIIIMNKGRIIDSGTHESLVKRNPYYAKIAAIQSLGEKI